MRKYVNSLLTVAILGYASISYAENGMKNTCEDFYPTDGLNNLLTQIYNHLDEPCLRDISTNHLDKLGVAIAIYPYGSSTEEDKKIREEALEKNPSDFLIILGPNTKEISSFSVFINPIFDRPGQIINTLTKRVIPKLPVPYEKYRRHTSFTPLYPDHPIIAWNNWGEFEPRMTYKWSSLQTKSSIYLETELNPGYEYINIRLK